MRRIGTQTNLGDEERKNLIDGLVFWRNRCEELYSDREELERSFYCVWNHQNVDGTVHDEDNASAWPFDGASDQRLRWGDMVFAEWASLIMLALSSAEVTVTCPAAPDADERAAAIKLLLKWELNKVGAKGMGEILALLHYFLVDSPAVGAMDVAWRRRTTLGVREIDANDLEEEFSGWATAAMDVSADEAAGMFWGQIRGETDGVEVENYLVSGKGVRARDARKVMKALAEDGQCECLVAVERQEGPELKALRYADDFCLPMRTDDFDYASPWYRSEWLSESQIRERVASDEWDAKWVEETLQYKGVDYYLNDTATTIDELKDMVNVVWCYTCETNEEGETVRWVAVLSHADGSAFGRRVIKTRRGKWNTVLFRREVVGSNVLESRGLAEICGPAQGVAKSVRDGAANNAIVGSLPPVKAKGQRTRNSKIAPFEVIPMGTNDDVLFMQPPAYPAAAKESEEKIKAELLEYVGVSDGQKDVSERRQAFINWILAQFRDLYITLVEVAQDNASDEILAGVTGDGDVKGLRREDITGDFGLTLELDPRNLDNKALIDKATAFSQVLLGMDRAGTVDTDPVVRHLMHLLFPEVRSALKSPEQMTANDVEEEKRNFVLIKAGIMPRMDTEGKWNYAARLEFYQQMMKETPDVVEDMSPRAQEMLQQWMSALQQQQTQFGENAQIGRTGVESVSAN